MDHLAGILLPVQWGSPIPELFQEMIWWTYNCRFQKKDGHLCLEFPWNILDSSGCFEEQNNLKQRHVPNVFLQCKLYYLFFEIMVWSDIWHSQWLFNKFTIISDVISNCFGNCTEWLISLFYDFCYYCWVQFFGSFFFKSIKTIISYSCIIFVTLFFAFITCESLLLLGAGHSTAAVRPFISSITTKFS